MLMMELQLLVSFVIFSALNEIEHAWSPLSDKLTNVVLKATLQNESSPPSVQSSLTPAQRE